MGGPGGDGDGIVVWRHPMHNFALVNSNKNPPLLRQQDLCVSQSHFLPTDVDNLASCWSYSPLLHFSLLHFFNTEPNGWIGPRGQWNCALLGAAKSGTLKCNELSTPSPKKGLLSQCQQSGAKPCCTTCAWLVLGSFPSVVSCKSLEHVTKELVTVKMRTVRKPTTMVQLLPTCNNNLGADDWLNHQKPFGFHEARHPVQACTSSSSVGGTIQMRSFGRAPPDFAPSPRGATGVFRSQNLDLAGAHLGSRIAGVE